MHQSLYQQKEIGVKESGQNCLHSPVAPQYLAIAICDVFHNRDQGGDIGGNLPPDYDSGFSFSYYSSLTGGRSQELHLLKL